MVNLQEKAIFNFEKAKECKDFKVKRIYIKKALDLMEEYKKSELYINKK